MGITDRNNTSTPKYPASNSAQAYFAGGNNEWPVVKSVTAKNEASTALVYHISHTYNMGDPYENHH